MKVGIPPGPRGVVAAEGSAEAAAKAAVEWFHPNGGCHLL